MENINSGDRKIYECGPLRYTLGGVITVCALIMLGFFCMNFSACAVRSMLPLELKALGASDMSMAFIMSTIGGVFNLTICPMVSFKSDRYRGKRWGRRCVFIIGTLPMYCAALFLFAFSGKIGTGLSNLINHWFQVAPTTVTIAVFGVIMAMYQFFYMFVASVIYYLFNDVVPTRFLARVSGMTNVAATAASALFNFFFFKYARSHFSELLIMTSIIYAAGTGLMCFLLKEPQLPPLKEDEIKASSGFRSLITFMRESFSHRFYWFAFCGTAIFGIGHVISTFLLFFYQNMDMDLAAIGKLNGITGISGTVFGFILASLGTILVDKWHPVRINVFGTLMLLSIPLVNLRWIWVSPGAEIFFNVFLAENVMAFFITAAVALAGMPSLMLIFPKSRFGQFCSARAMLCSICNLVMGLVLGIVIDCIRRWTGGEGENVYRLLWIWRLFWGILGGTLMLLMYREYCRLGGEHHFQAPAVWDPSGVEEVASEGKPADPKQLKIALFFLDIVLLIYPLSAIFRFWQLRQTAAETAAKFLSASAIPLILLIIFYLFLRKKWGTEMKKLRDGKVKNTIHHGVIFMAAGILLLRCVVMLYQAILMGTNNLKADNICFFTEIICAGAILLIAAFNGILEKKMPEK